VQTILILDKNFNLLKTLSRELSNSQSWETRTYDLSELSGQTIYLYFGVANQPPCMLMMCRSAGRHNIIKTRF